MKKSIFELLKFPPAEPQPPPNSTRVPARRAPESRGRASVEFFPSGVFQFGRKIRAGNVSSGSGGTFVRCRGFGPALSILLTLERIEGRPFLLEMFTYEVSTLSGCFRARRFFLSDRRKRRNRSEIALGTLCSSPGPPIRRMARSALLITMSRFARARNLRYETRPMAAAGVDRSRSSTRSDKCSKKNRDLLESPLLRRLSCRHVRRNRRETKKGFPT